MGRTLRGNAGRILPVNACSVRKRKWVDSVSQGSFCLLLIFFSALRPWHIWLSGGLRRTLVYACVVRSRECACTPQVEIAALRDIARAASMDAASAKFEGGGAAARHLARALHCLKPGSSRETRARLTVILSPLRVRSNWSATFLKAIETDCVGRRPRLVSLLTEPAQFATMARLSRMTSRPPASLLMWVVPTLPQTPGLQRDFLLALCRSVFLHAAPLHLDGRRPLRSRTTLPG